MKQSLAEALSAAQERLTAAGVQTPYDDARVLLAWGLGLWPWELEHATDLGEADQTVFESALRRRERREPLEYITGLASFRGLRLAVGPGVFIPRPETEPVAGAAIRELRCLMDSGASTPTAVDLGSGCGAIAIAIAKEVPGSKVTAAEVSTTACAYCRHNAARHAVALDVACTAMSDLPDDLNGTAQVVVANPPYVGSPAERALPVEATRYEPPSALWTCADPLALVEEVCRVSARLLGEGGLVACEHSETTGDAAVRLWRRHGAWSEVTEHQDLGGRPRFLTARRRGVKAEPTSGTIRHIR